MNTNESSKLNIGIFSLEGGELITEDTAVRASKLKGSGYIKIDIYTNEGEQKPHFHLEKVQDRSKKMAIELFFPRVFDHGTKYKNFLNDNEKAPLNKLLTTSCSKDQSISVWEYMKNIWLTKFISSQKLYSDVIQPDFSKLISTKPKGQKIFINPIKTIRGEGNNKIFLCYTDADKNYSITKKQKVMILNEKEIYTSKEYSISKGIYVKKNNSSSIEEFWISGISDSIIDDMIVSSVLKDNGYKVISYGDKDNE